MNKRIIITIGCLLAFNFYVLAQDIHFSKATLKPVLCKQWQIEYAMMGEMKIGQKIGATDFDMKFNTDGTYDLIHKDGKTQKGKWVYYADKKYVELSIDDKVTSRVKSVNKTTLILTLVSGENDPPGLPQLEVHFKPI